MTPSVFVAGILTFLWPHLHGTGALVALALLYGAFIGAFAALISSPMIALGDSTDVGRRTGMYLTITSLGSLMGPPISGAINRATGGYSAVGIYAGQFRFILSQRAQNGIGTDGASMALFYFCYLSLLF
jgi:MFS transporter, MCT family, solute carrier family 16 (monocarboxylic acid transporters), member 10